MTLAGRRRQDYGCFFVFYGNARECWQRTSKGGCEQPVFKVELKQNDDDFAYNQEDVDKIDEIVKKKD